VPGPAQGAPMSYSRKVPRTFQSGERQPAGELDLIHRIRERSSRPRGGEVRLGIGDDCALLRPRSSEELAVTTDLSIAGRHFQLEWHPPEAVGHRTLARGLSDLAAMGARPVAAFLSLGLPRELAASRKSSARTPSSPAWLDKFLDGFLALAAATGTPLAGGDLAESPIFVADIVLTGAVRRGRALLRSGARPGDLLYVTGALGGAAAGLARLTDWAAQQPQSQTDRTPRPPRALEPTLTPHLYPQPRLAQGQWLVRRKAATAALDISDGLSTDLAHLCEESRVTAEIDAVSLPIHTGATLEQALHGGEDYELLFTASPASRLPRSIAGVPVTQIGRIVRKNARRPQMTLLTAQGRQPLAPRGWEHFA
jgi:thiamine-monophosphate kinase